MTVSELIAALQKFPLDQRVVTRGREGDYDDILVLKARIKVDTNRIVQPFEGGDDLAPITLGLGPHGIGEENDEKHEVGVWIGPADAPWG